MTIWFRDWEFEIYKEVTQAAYRDRQRGAADACRCSNCENFARQRVKVYPYEIRELLLALGIDWTKEVGVYAFNDPDNGNYLYTGWFQFAGRILHGETRFSSLEDGGLLYNLTPITKKFKICFFNSTGCIGFSETVPTVQLEFEVSLPWLLPLD